MRQKHFNKIAEKFAQNIQRIEQINSVFERQVAREQARHFIEGVADVCADENPRFDRGRFYSACGL